MNPYNQRKEPTFGKPSEAEVATENHNETADKVGNVAPQAQPTAPVKANPTETTTVENATQSSKTEGQKMAFSLHTKNAPNYTFTPVMKRPAEQAAALSTLEEQAEHTMSNEKAPLAPQSQATPTSSPEKQPTPNGGFAFAPVAEGVENASTVTPAVNAKPVNAQSDLKAEQATPASLVERVIPAAAAKTAVEKVPSKYRRLAIVILLLLLIILGIWLLKPSTPQSVETLQEQGSSLPIEFRPVDEEEAKRAEAQAKALQEAQAQSVEAQANATAQNGEQAVASQPLSAQATASTAQPAVEAQTATAQVVSAQAQSGQEQAVKTQAVKEQAGKAQTAKEQTVVAVQKPQTTGSVIYQPETAKTVKANVTAPKTQATAPVKAPKQPHVEAVKAEAVKPAVVAKPVVKQPTPAPAKVAPAPVAVASKTLTVPKGVSLMQVFRDNNLNISDVNAMSRANGVVSNLKVGEKVTVRLDKNNRVAEMRIGSGGTFIRQANGSYLYK